MRQTTFSDIEYSNRRRITRREQFLSTMDSIIPWEDWVNLIRPFYPAGKRGRPPKDIETMLRMYLMQKWYKMSDGGIEDAVYDSYAMRQFMKLDFLKEQVPGASTLLRFRHMLKQNSIDEKIAADLEERLKKEGLALRGGRITDAGFLNTGAERYPEKA